MKKGYLSTYFSGVAIKKLSQVEVEPLSSHQHEFNGVNGLKKILGSENLIEIPAKYIYLNEDEPVEDESTVTWYESRGDYYPKSAPVEQRRYRSEYRLYFKDTTATMNAAAGDTLIVAKRTDKKEGISLIIIIAQAETTIANQVAWLFGFGNEDYSKFSIKEDLEADKNRLTFTSKLILEKIGITLEDEDDSYLDEMCHLFGERFPATTEFSAFARSKAPDISLWDDPDDALTLWMDMEEILFRTFERYLLQKKIRTCIQNQDVFDLDRMRSFFMSSMQSGKSRAGKALENHVEFIFKQRDIAYTRNPVTENNNKPDFIFPGIEAYRDSSFPASSLSMLGLKTSSKDRWRQMLSEANRIEEKHFLTLEPSISIAQTNDMQLHHMNLVTPISLHQTYKPEQQEWLMSFQDFINLLESKKRE